jgi:Ca2+-transporting ATPase
VVNATASPHAVEADSVIAALASEPRRGLTSAQAAQRRVEHGANELAAEKPVPLWQKFLGQFREIVIWILIVAAAISGALGEWVDTAAILAIVLLNGVLGFLQEERAERALAALQRLAAPLTRVVRDGQVQSLPARELVPGDRIELEAGDNVPADVRLIDAFSLRVQEAALTGESLPVDKTAGYVLDESTPLGDPPQHGLSGDRRGCRQGQRGRRRDRHEDRVGPDRRAAWPLRSGANAASAAAGGVGHTGVWP